MKRPIALLVLLLLAALTAAAGSDLVALQRPTGASGVVIVPDRFLRSWDPVTVFFPSDRGPEGGGPEDHPDAHARMAPDHPGAWEWLDARTLQFRPAEPWPALALFGVGAGGRSLDLFTLLAPPTATHPRDGATGLGPVESIVLTFGRPVPAEALARMATIELVPLPGLGEEGRRRLDASDFEVKALDRLRPDEPARYALVLDRPIPLGHRATVHLGLALDRADESSYTLTFATAEPFRATSIGCGGGSLPLAPAGTLFAADRPVMCSGDNRLWVDFTARPAALGPVEARNLVRFDPAVEDLDFALSGRRLEITGRFRPETAYTVTLSPTPLSDESGRTLDMEGPSSATFVFRRRNPFLTWGEGGGLLELHGPKVLPLQGRGHGKLDVRVVRVDPLDRSFWPFPADPIALDEERRPPHPGEEPEPWTAVSPIHRAALEQQLRGLRTPGLSRIVELPVDANGDAARFGLDLSGLLAEASDANQPGHYLVGIRRLDGGSTRSWRRIQVTDLALATVASGDQVRFSVTSLSTGSPVNGAVVRIEGEEWRRGENPVRAVHFEGRTDARGFADWTAPGRPLHVDRTVDRIVVERGQDQLVLDPHQAPSRFRNGSWSDGNGWLDWAVQNTEGRVEPPRRLGHLFSERPVYRPGETVHLRGYVRERHQGRFSAVKGAGHVVIRGPGGEVYRKPVELVGAGNFYTTFDEEAPSAGVWRATFEDGEGHTLGEASFQIEAYRLPTFEARLHGDSVVPNDQPFHVQLVASYYAGGRVADEAVRWRVTQYPYDWSPAAVEGFAWSSDARFGRWRRFESTPALDREDRTDGEGAARLALDPGVEPTAQPRTYVVEATVTGADAQTVTTVERFHALPAFALGLKVPRWLERVDAIRPEVLVVGPDGEPIAGKQVTVRLLNRQWHSRLQASDFSDGVARYVTDVTDIPVSEETVTSAATPVTVPLPIDRSGVWIVELEARDQLGRAQVVRVDLYAGGADAVAWEKPTTGTFAVTLDKQHHRPGDTARILIRSPFQQAEALVVIEAPDGNRYERVAVRGGQATVRLPIEEGWTPSLPVHIALSRGRKDVALPPGARVDPGRPETLATTVHVTVEPVENQVRVGLSAPEKAMPGQEVPVTLTLAAPDGKPLSGEVTLWLVDRAVLALGTEARLDPIPDFVMPRRVRVEIQDSRNLVLGRVPTEPMPGGDGEEEAEDAGMDHISVRQDIRAVAYYRAGIPVDASGKATVKVKLPDNLTTFAIRAKATSGASRFGVAKGQIAVRLPVVAQPALPRFVRPGDSFDATVIARVVEGPQGAGRAKIEASGLSIRGSTAKDFTFGDKASVVGFPAAVQTPPLDEAGRLAREDVQIKLVAQRRADGAGDAVQISLPLADDREPIVRRTLSEGEDQVRVPALEEPAREGSVHRQVVVGEPGMLRLVAALDVLRRAPRYSTGTRLDAARGWLAVLAFREPLALAAEVTDEADAAVLDAQRWLEDVVDGRGLVADWPGSRGSVHRTADAVLFLVEAKAQGRRVDEALLASLLGTLKRSLRSDYAVFVDGESWYERTRSLHALAAAGSMDEAYWSELLRNQSLLGTDGSSRVVLAAARAGEGRRAGMDALVDRLEKDVTTRLVDGVEVYGGLASRQTQRNPLILPSEARTLAELARAVASVRPTSARLGLVVDALVSIGGKDGWGSTDADREALLALADALARRPSPEREVTLTVGGQTQKLRLGGGRAVAVWQGDDPGLIEIQTGGAGVLAISRYLPEPPGSAVEPEARGYVVERTLSRIATRGPADKLAVEAQGTVPLRVGDVVEDHVRVVVPETRHYVAVTVPLAAGLEPLNPNLATSPPEARPSAGPTLAPTATLWSDHEVTWTYETLPKGTYELRFRARATTAGQFVQPPARALSLYEPARRGHSAGTTVQVHAE